MVLDTNVLVSALFWSGPEAAVVRLVEEGAVEGYTSPAILDELSRVLRYPRIELTDEEAEDAVGYYVTILSVVRPKIRLVVVEDDLEDKRVLECSEEAHANFIVSGDRHLLEIHEYKNVKIVRASEFLEEMKVRQSS